MTDNQDRLMHGRVSQHAFVCRERARPSRPLVGATLFDKETPTSKVHVSPTLSFRRHVSLIATLKVHFNHIVDDVVV